MFNPGSGGYIVTRMITIMDDHYVYGFLVATTSTSFDPRKQLYVGEVISAKAYAIALIKWSKTL